MAHAQWLWTSQSPRTGVHSCSHCSPCSTISRTVHCSENINRSHCSLFEPNSANERTAITFVRSLVNPGTSKVSFRNSIIIWQYLRSKINPSFITLNISGMSIINRLSVDFVIKCDVLKVPVWVPSWSLQIRKWMKRLLVLFKNVTPDVQNFPFFKNCLMTALLRQPLSSKGSTPLANFRNFHWSINIPWSWQNCILKLFIILPPSGELIIVLSSNVNSILL